MSHASPPSKPLLLLAGGVALGMLSWLAALAVSGRFEPYDSGMGLLANQLALSVPAVFLASRYRPSAPFLFLCGAYVGMNAYTYGFGGSEKKAWAALGAVTSLSLLLLPAVLVTVIAVIRRVRRVQAQRTNGGSRSGQP